MRRARLISAALGMWIVSVLPVMVWAADFEPFDPADEAAQSWWTDPVASRRISGSGNGTGLFLSAPPDDAQGRTAAPGDPVASSYMEMGYSQPVKSGTWHFAGAHGRNQTATQLGFSTRRFHVAGFSGSGEGVATLPNGYAYLDPFHFHGGSAKAYGYNGVSVRQGFGQGSLHVSSMAIDARGLETRKVHAAGLTWRQHGATAVRVLRGGDDIGKVYSLFSGSPRIRVGLDHMVHRNGARHTALTLSGVRKGVRYGVSLVEARNPLYDVKNERRLQFGLSFSTRKLHRGFAVTESADQEEAEESNSRNYLIAGGLVAIGLGLSSGSSGGDSDSRFSGQDQAAFNVLNRINPRSVAENREYGGYVYRNPDGSYASTRPIQGEVASVRLPFPSDIVPSGSSASATYHTHGGPDPRFDNENFSPVDIATDEFLGLDGYLGTPAGKFRYHNVVTGEIVTLGTIAN